MSDPNNVRVFLSNRLQSELFPAPEDGWSGMPSTVSDMYWKTYLLLAAT